MKKTRAQLLCIFQVYLDRLKIFDPERRDNLGRLYLERGLSRATERDFSYWLKTNQHMEEKTRVMRTRGSRLATFSTFLDRYRPFMDRDGRERLIRLYNNKQLSRVIEREFHQFVRAEIHDGRELP